jgi:RNA recognition motif-containing protein
MSLTQKEMLHMHKPRGSNFNELLSVNNANKDDVQMLVKKFAHKHTTCKPQLETHEQSDRRIFVGGLPVDAKPEDVEAAFNEMGLTVSRIDIKLADKARENSKNRGFGFVDFENEKQFTKACEAKFININGKRVEIKKAIGLPHKSQKTSYFSSKGQQLRGYQVRHGHHYCQHPQHTNVYRLPPRHILIRKKVHLTPQYTAKAQGNRKLYYPIIDKSNVHV